MGISDVGVYDILAFWGRGRELAVPYRLRGIKGRWGFVIALGFLALKQFRIVM